MNHGVPQKHESLFSDSLAASRCPAASRRPVVRAGAKMFRAGLLLLGLLSTLLFASSAMGATATVGLGSAASFSVLGGETITNTGPTTMFGDLGLSPGSAVTGAPHVLGQTHVDDAVAIGAKNALTTAYNNAASRPSNGSAGTDLAGQTFLPGVRTASSSLLLSSGSVTLDAQGDPNAVFIFQIGSKLTTGSSTTVLLVGGAQACNVFWQVGSSATLGTGTHFAGTIMASASISATTAATIHGRLLARTGAVTLDTNTITTSTCASSVSGSGGGLETTTGAGSTTSAGSGSGGSAGTTKPVSPTGSKTTGKNRQRLSSRRRHRRHSARRAPKRRSPARPALPHQPGTFTG
jgi:Ice-binding-like